VGAVVTLSGCTGGDNGAALAAQACGEKPLAAHEIQQGIAIPRGFEPVAATRCVFAAEGLPEDGQSPVRIEQRATGDLTALVAALKEPNRYSTKVECTMIARRAFVITLVDKAGSRVTPTVPTFDCGGSYASVRTAVQQLSWMEVSRTRVSQGPGWYDPHPPCPTGLKPVVAMAAAEPDRPTGPASVPDGKQWKVCEYALYPADGGDLRDGRIGTTMVIGGQWQDQFRAAALAAPPVTGTCVRPQPNAVLIFQLDQSSDHPLTVETGGCFRMLDSGGVLRQLDAATVALLTIATPEEWGTRDAVTR
jgi:hypothetical protein